MNIDKFGRHLMTGVTHQTTTDKFGRHISSSASDLILRQQPVSSFLPLTADGQYDVGSRRLCNVDTPVAETDCANKAYVDIAIQSSQKAIQTTLSSLPASSSSTSSPASSTPITNIVRDVFTLRLDLNNWKREQTISIKDLTETIHHVKKAVDDHDKKLSPLGTLENRIKLELDEFAHKLRKEHELTQNELSKLVKDYDKTIANLHKKIKAIETALQP